MFISKEKYEKLVARNKYLTEKVHELEKENKWLTLNNYTYYEGAIKWRDMYNKIYKMFNDRETESPIVAQRNEEIEALKHMLERLEAEQEKIRKENEYLKAKCERFGEPSQRIVCELSKRGIHY